MGLQALYYGVRDGKAVKIWPAEGKHRVKALRLDVSGELGALMSAYSVATRAFTEGNGYLRVRLGNREWRLDSGRADIAWDENGSQVVFQRGSGPWADRVLRGDFVSIECGMDGYSCMFQVGSTRLSEMTQVGYCQAVSTMDIRAKGAWYGHEDAGAAGVRKSGDEWLVQRQAWSKKKNKKGGRSYYTDEGWTRGVTGGPYPVYLYGYPGCAEVEVVYPPGMVSLNAKVLDVIVGA